MGCGAIGSGIAEAIHNGLHPRLVLAGIYDTNPDITSALCQKFNSTVIKKSFSELITCADLIVEAVSAPNTRSLLESIIKAKKDVMVMSVGVLLDAHELFESAKKSGCRILVPSGAVSGIDAIKAARLAGIDSVTITTRKPIRGLQGAPFIKQHNISLDKIIDETVIFDGTVTDAVKAFPQNINVAATVALASGSADKMRIRILTSPDFKYNRHEIDITGSFGRLTTITENLPSPSNAKTSYLAVLSGIETLRSFVDSIKIGT